MRLLKFAHLALAVALTGCTVLSQRECEQVDWRKQGYDTAFWQKDRDAVLNYYRKYCGEDNEIQPDLALFEAGFKEGKNFLCTRDGGYEFGRGGGVYSRTCGKDKEDEFFIGYQRGQIVYSAARIQDLQRQVTGLKSELNGKQRRIDQLESQQRKMHSQLNTLQSKSRL